MADEGATLESMIEGEGVENTTQEAEPVEGQYEEAAEQQPEKAEASDVEDLKRRLQMTEQQLEYFRELLRQNQDIISLYKQNTAKQEEADPLEQLDPDEPLTVRQVKAMQKRLMDETMKNVQEVESRYRRSLAAISEKAARLRYSDYDEVLKYAVEMAQRDPLILQKIASSDDPAEEAYLWGQRNPKYIEKIKSKTKTDVADKIKTNLNKTSAAVPNRSSSVSNKDVWEMTPEQFSEYKRRIMEK